MYTHGSHSSPVRPSSSCARTEFCGLPYGVLSAKLEGVDDSGKRPTVRFSGRIADKTQLDVVAVRTDLCTRQVFIELGSSKKDCGNKGQVNDYTRTVELSDISTKLAHIHGGETWQINLVNSQRETLDSQTVVIGGPC